MDEEGKLEKILGFHLKELQAAAWEGDYEDIGKRHQKLFKNLFEDYSFELPTKKALGNASLNFSLW